MLRKLPLIVALILAVLLTGCCRHLQPTSHVTDPYESMGNHWSYVGDLPLFGGQTEGSEASAGTYLLRAHWSAEVNREDDRVAVNFSDTERKRSSHLQLAVEPHELGGNVWSIAGINPTGTVYRTEQNGVAVEEQAYRGWILAGVHDNARHRAQQALKAMLAAGRATVTYYQQDRLVVDVTSPDDGKEEQHFVFPPTVGVLRIHARLMADGHAVVMENLVANFGLSDEPQLRREYERIESGGRWYWKASGDWAVWQDARAQRGTLVVHNRSEIPAPWSKAPMKRDELAVYLLGGFAPRWYAIREIHQPLTLADFLKIWGSKVGLQQRRHGMVTLSLPQGEVVKDHMSVLYNQAIDPEGIGGAIYLYNGTWVDAH